MTGVSMSEILAMRAAYEAASVSPDRSTQNGAAISVGGSVVIATCNRFVLGVDGRWPGIHERPLKYSLMVHAERSAVYVAARAGIRLEGSVMTCPWAPCPECAQAIIESGIRRLVAHKDRYDKTPARWKDSVDIGLSMLRDAGVEVAWIEGSVNAGVRILFDGIEIEV